MSKAKRRAQAVRRAAVARSALPTVRAVLAKRDGHHPDCTDSRPHFVPPSFGDVGFFACNPPDPAAPVTEPRADCVFCGRIKRGEYDGSGAVSFEPLNPVVPGHRLFVPGWHCADAREIEGVAAAAKLAAWHASKTDEDFNLITSAGGAATQTVFHLHVHYVPRRPDDGLLLPWSDLPAALLDGHEQQIRAKALDDAYRWILNCVDPAQRGDEVKGEVLAALREFIARGTEGGTR